MRIKKINKIFSLAIIAIILVNFLSAFSYNVQALSYTEMVEQSKQFLSSGSAKAGEVPIDAITSEFIPLGQILTMIGAGVMVAVTVYMGIKYLTSGPDAQAKLKQQLIGVVVSGVVIFGAYGIWSTVLRIAQNFD